MRLSDPPAGAPVELALLDYYLPMMQSAALVAAGELGLFEALAEGPRDAAALAEAHAADAGGVARLADFLVALGYLERQGEAYANAERTQRWFTSRGHVDYTPGLHWTREAWQMMGDLASAVRRGGPAQTLWQKMDEAPHLGSTFADYMAAFARDLGPDLLAFVPVQPGQCRLLDLGGSHGLHTIRFCERYPQLTAHIVDLPSALARTPETLARHGLDERVTLSCGNVLDFDWGAPYDLVFYLSVAHNQRAADNRAIIQRIHDSLAPGGLLVIHEYLDDPARNAFLAAFRLTLLYETGTALHSEAEYREWLGAAGFSSVERIDLAPAEKGSLLLARA